MIELTLSSGKQRGIKICVKKELVLSFSEYEYEDKDYPEKIKTFYASTSCMVTIKIPSVIRKNMEPSFELNSQVIYVQETYNEIKELLCT